MKKLNWLQRVKVGLRKGWETPTLPDHILKIEKHPFVRLFRVIGGICVGILLTRRYIWFPSPFLYLFVFFALIFTIYLITLFVLRLYHIYKSIKNKDLEIKIKKALDDLSKN